MGSNNGLFKQQGWLKINTKASHILTHTSVSINSFKLVSQSPICVYWNIDIWEWLLVPDNCNSVRVWVCVQHVCVGILLSDMGLTGDSVLSAGLCVCVCVRVCVCRWVWLCVCVCLPASACNQACLSVHICLCVIACVSVCVCVCVWLCLFLRYLWQIVTSRHTDAHCLPWGG